ncbi:hypothetical protein RND81_07G088900 [Saponaria officinalis]|uniref:Uncharacterized protein n=1 Tax=Saponaria officinalis TaxID=3572 RepID=A0AAW1JLD6_SAPOF
MPGIKQWEKVNMPEPLPPPYKKMPGRPNSRKRKKEAGKGESKRVKRARKPNKCGKCGQLGHNTKTSKNEAIAKEPVGKAPPRPQSTSQWSTKVRERVAKRKAEKQAHYKMVAQSGNENSQAPQDPIIPSQSSVCRASTIS